MLKITFQEQKFWKLRKKRMLKMRKMSGKVQVLSEEKEANGEWVSVHHSSDEEQ